MLNYFVFCIILFSFPRASDYFFTNLKGDCIITGNQIYSANFPNNFNTPNLCQFEVQKAGWIASTELSAQNVEVVIGRDIYPSVFTHSLTEPIDQQVWQYDMIQVVALTNRNSGSFVLEFVENRCDHTELQTLFNKNFFVSTDCSDENISLDEVCSCLATIEPKEADRFDCIWNVHSWNPKHVKSVSEYCRETTCAGTSCSCDINTIRAEIPVWVSNYGQQVEEPCSLMVDSMGSGIFTDQIICNCFNELPQDPIFALGCTFDELGLTFAAKAKECRGYRDPTTSPSATLPSNCPTYLPSIQPSHSPSISFPTTSPTASEPSLPPVTSSPSNRPSTRPSLSSPTKSPTSSEPSFSPSMIPTTAYPTIHPFTSSPTITPSTHPSHLPSNPPSTQLPSKFPSTALPSMSPFTTDPSFSPSISFPSTIPSYSPSISAPTVMPTVSSPSTRPTTFPSITPSEHPTNFPSTPPSSHPTSSTPSRSPSKSPTSTPSFLPSLFPTSDTPSFSPSSAPTPSIPTISPSKQPTSTPSFVPSSTPTSGGPSTSPLSSHPSLSPITASPTQMPTLSSPTGQPSGAPTSSPPSTHPSKWPSVSHPTPYPTTTFPSGYPTVRPTAAPSFTSPTSDPSSSPTETIYKDQIVLDEDFSNVKNVTAFCNECTAFLRTIPAVTEVACVNAYEGSIIIEIEGPEAENRLAKDYVATFGMNVTCCGQLGGMEIQTSVVIETSLVEVEVRSESEGSDNSIYTLGLYGLSALLVVVILGVTVWCCFCRPKPHLVKFIDDKFSESEDIITHFAEKRQPKTSKREPQTAKRQPQTLSAGKSQELPKLHSLVMDNRTQSQVSIDLTPRTTAPPPIEQIDEDLDLPQEGAEYDYDDCGGDSMRLLPLIDRELEEALEFDPEFVYLKDQIASLLGQAAKFEPGAIRSQWEAQAQFSKDALLKLCRLRFGDERTENYKPRMEKIWRETTDIARRLSVTTVRGLFFKFFDISHDGDVTAEEFKSIANLIMPNIEAYMIDETFQFIDTGNRGAFTPIEIQTFLDKQWGGRARKFRQAVIEYMSCHSIQETHEKLASKFKRRPEINLDVDSHEEDELFTEDTEAFGNDLLQKMRQLRRDMDNRRLSTAFDNGLEEEDEIRTQMQNNSLSSLGTVPEEYLKLGDHTDGLEYDLKGGDHTENVEHDDLQIWGVPEYLDQSGHDDDGTGMELDDLDCQGVVHFDSESEELSSLEASPLMTGKHASQLSTGSIREVDFDLSGASI